MQAANGFMMIIECSQAKVLFVSDTIRDVLKENPEQWIGSCLYDKLHHKVQSNYRLLYPGNKKGFLGGFF